MKWLSAIITFQIVFCLIPTTHVMAASDDNWDGRFYANGVQIGGGSSNVIGTINAIAVSGSNVYVGGDFSSIFGVKTTNVAHWDGSTWSAMGTGTNAPVHALAVSGTDVYVGGDFTAAGGGSASHIAKWNGTSWSPLSNGTNNRVHGLAVVGSTVYAAGRFTSAGGSGANQIAQWNGTSWSALGAGVDGEVFALAALGTDVYVGGAFTNAGGSSANHIAKWDGSSWSALGTGTNNNVNSLAVNGTDLYVGGSFSSAGGSGANFIAKWNGTSWSTLSSGMNGGVFALAVSGGNLYALGGFSTAGGSPIQSIARWDGSTWSGLAGSLNILNANPDIMALAASGSDLYVGGQFVGAGASAAVGLAHWDGSTWSIATSNPGAGIAGQPFYQSVHALARSTSGDLYAGGAFYLAGTVSAIGVAKWDNTSWSPLGGGLEGPTDANFFHGYANALTFYGSDLVIGGNFTTAGGVTVNHIALWDGLGYIAMGTGMSGNFQHVNALTVYNGDLYAGGSFAGAGGAFANNIAHWNGTSWLALGSGTNGTVNALAVVGSDLYVGGSFTTAGGVSVSNIAKWDGTSWSAVGSGLDNTVLALAAAGSNLYAGGSFSNAISKWDGSTWSNLGGGICTFCGSGGHTVQTLAAVGSDLYVGGPFNLVDGTTVPANQIAKWNGTSWSALGSGASGGTPTAFAFAGADVYVAGDFSSLGVIPSSFIGLWHTCGNGLLDNGEQCDDGNLVNGDCCSSACQFEAANAPCPDDGNLCTDDQCNASGTCTHPPNSDPCDDGLFCNGSDTCSGGGCNSHTGDPCAGGADCADICNEAAHNCIDPAGTSCNSDGNPCTIDTCDGVSPLCQHPAGNAGAVCRASAGVCDVAESCDGTNAACPADGFQSMGTACTTDGNPCTDDVCNAGGACTHPNNTAPCDDGNACTIHDACSGGSCVGDPHICGDGVVEGSCGEQCDDGGTVAGDGCDGSCQLEKSGRTCKRAIELQTRKLAVKDVTLEQACLDNTVAGPVRCLGVCNIAVGAGFVPVSGSSCTTGADCCPAYDALTASFATQASMDKAAATTAKKIKTACSLAPGPDGVKGTDDDTYISPQTLGFGATCPDIQGSCSSINTMTMSSPGVNNDLADCAACASVAGARVLGFHYPSHFNHNSGLSTEARKLTVYDLTQQQTCLDKVANDKLTCAGTECVLNPTAKHPVFVPNSVCNVAADCCPAFDNANPAKSTQAKLTKYAATAATVIKKALSLNSGPDGIQGTDDDTFTDPQTLHYGDSCLAVSGQCGTIPITETVLAGPSNDLVECVACTQGSVASGLTSSFAPPTQ